MKNSKVLLFITLIVLTITCESSKAESLRIDFDDPIFSKLNKEGKDIIREYAKVYPKIKDFYRNIRMDVTEKIIRHTASEKPLEYIPLDSPPVLRREEAIEMRYNARDGVFFRDDSQITFHWRDSLSVSGKNVSVEHAKQITLITPEKSYSLSKRNPNSQFYSLSARRNTDGFSFVLRAFDSAPFSVGPMLLEDQIFCRPLHLDKRFHFFILSAQYTEDDHGKEVVEFVTWTGQPEPPSRPCIYTIRLSRDTWVIEDILEQAYSRAGQKFWKRYRCIYDGEFEGMPLLSSYQEDLGVYDTDECQTEILLEQTLCEVTKIIPGPVDLSEFDVAQFLPPNVKIGEITQAQLSPARIAAIVIGIILIILGIYLKIRSIRKE